ncbi:MAG: lysophospholipid acyltransferase family protein [Elusimicrobiota bacterium]|jgi:long-chain acyl-CoA synthetase
MRAEPAVPGSHIPYHARPRSAANRLARYLLGLVQLALYRHFFRVRVVGAHNVPSRGGLVIAANHASHLDMGLIKHALGPAGRELVSVAAKDYFFQAPLRRWYFTNFTNLLPFNRRASLHVSLRAAGRVLADARNLLIFPEGTRTRDGRMGAFGPTLGFLALKFSADVLPVYISGVFEAMPKGAWLPRRRALGAAIGPLVSAAELRERTAGLPNTEAYRAATIIIEEAVRKAGQAAFGIMQPI